MTTVTNREDWLKERKKGIGASEASCILGLNHWKTNVDLWKEKTGQVEPENIDDKECVFYGKKAEQNIRALFELDYPQFDIEYDEFGMIANRPNEPWLFATLDGHIIDDERNGVLEIKTTTIQQSSQWQQWNEQVPDYYYVQVLHQLLATGYDFSVLRADIRYYKKDELRHTMRDYVFEREELSDDLEYLLEKEIEFKRCIDKKIQPNLILPEI